MKPTPAQPFTPSEQAKIERCFLEEGHATCPHDTTELEIQKFRGEGPITNLMATCGTCFRHSNWKREPHKERDWTKAESGELVAKLEVHGVAHCQVCNTRVLLMSPGTPYASPLCPGCGNHGRGV